MFARLIAIVLFALALPATAQTRVDCVTRTCTIVSDAISAPATAPTLCRLYAGATRLAEVSVVAPFACSFTRSFAAGAWSVTARYATATEEGPDSNMLAFTSAAPLPPPANLRFR